MPDIDSLIGLVFFIVFIIVAIARKIAEQRDISKQQEQMRRQKPQELPEATRRMLYGDTIPTAQPRTFGDEDEERPVFAPQRRETTIPTAEPREGLPRRPVPPPVAPRQAQPASVPPARPTAPPVRVPAPQPQRTSQAPTVFRPDEDQPRRQAPPMRQPQRVQRTVRREAPPPLAPAQQARRPASKAKPAPAAPEPQVMRRATAMAGRYFDNRDDLRRAVVLREILGPPKAFEGLD